MIIEDEEAIEWFGRVIFWLRDDLPFDLVSGVVVAGVSSARPGLMATTRMSIRLIVLMAVVEISRTRVDWQGRGRAVAASAMPEPRGKFVRAAWLLSLRVSS